MRYARVLILAALATCGGATAPKISATGNWLGAVSGRNVTLSLSLSQTGNTVSGSGIFGTPVYGPVSLDVSGDFTGGTLTMTSNIYQPVTLSGTVLQRDIVGSLTGDSFTGTTVTLTRHPSPAHGARGSSWRLLESTLTECLPVQARDLVQDGRA